MTKIIKPLFFLFFAFISLTLYAQDGTRSPYSRYGVGDIDRNGFMVGKGMSGLGISQAYEGSINFSNPASYSAIKFTTIENVMNASILKLSTANASQVNYTSSFAHMAFAFPVTKNWGTSFGLVPFSNIGYRQSQAISQYDSTKATTIYSGNGGLSQFYIGNGFKIYKNLHAGLNISYVFGNTNVHSIVEYPENTGFFSTDITRSTFVGDVYANYGLQYRKALANDYWVNIGYAGSISKKMNTTTKTLAERYFYQGGSKRTVDTALNESGKKGTITLPFNNGIGFSYGKTNKWVAGVDAWFTNWSDYRENNVSVGLNNSFGLAVGGQITPKYNAIKKYYAAMDYRVGASFTRTQIEVAGTDISQYGISMGLGFPLIKSKSKINIAVELLERGTTKNNLIKEQYINFHLGFAFNDIWFIKRRYD